MTPEAVAECRAAVLRRVQDVLKRMDEMRDEDPRGLELNALETFEAIYPVLYGDLEALDSAYHAFLNMGGRIE